MSPHVSLGVGPIYFPTLFQFTLSLLQYSTTCTASSDCFHQLLLLYHLLQKLWNSTCDVYFNIAHVLITGPSILKGYSQSDMDTFHNCGL